MKRLKPDRWTLKPGDLPSERDTAREPCLCGMENNPAFRMALFRSKNIPVTFISAIGFKFAQRFFPLGANLSFRCYGELCMTGFEVEEVSLGLWGASLIHRRRRMRHLMASYIAIWALLLGISSNAPIVAHVAIIWISFRLVQTLFHPADFLFYAAVRERARWAEAEAPSDPDLFHQLRPLGFLLGLIAAPFVFIAGVVYLSFLPLAYLTHLPVWAVKQRVLELGQFKIEFGLIAAALAGLTGLISGFYFRRKTVSLLRHMNQSVRMIMEVWSKQQDAPKKRISTGHWMQDG